MKPGLDSEDLALMTIRALFGVKIFRRNAKHVVTLDANAMDERLSWRRSLMFWGMSLRLVRFCRHKEILAQQQATQHYGCGLRAPSP